jgi:hypothetical protein
MCSILNPKKPLMFSKRAVLILSILMFGTNVQANMFQSLMTIYLKSTDTSDRAVQILSRMGICLSTTSTNKAITSLSKQAEEVLRNAGKTLLVAPAYDNINMAFKVAEPTHEHDSQFVNMTTATGVMLVDVNKGDLEVCQQLWDRNYDNDTSLDPMQTLPEYDNLFTKRRDANNLNASRRVRRAMKWHLIRLMLDFQLREGDKNAKAYLKELGSTPGEVYQLLVRKTTQYPMRTMEEDESTSQGNINVCEDIERQLGLKGTGLWIATSRFYMVILEHLRESRGISTVGLPSRQISRDASNT